MCEKKKITPKAVPPKGWKDPKLKKKALVQAGVAGFMTGRPMKVTKEGLLEFIVELVVDADLVSGLQT